MDNCLTGEDIQKMDMDYVLAEAPVERTQIKQTAFKDYITAACVCFALCIFFLVITPGLLHWMLVPVFLCGTVIGADGIAWFRGQYDTFDVKGLIGVLGLHFFFLAPLIYLYLDEPTAYIDNPNDWRPWLGFMALLNFVGIFFYKYFQRIGFSGISKSKSVWCVNPSRTWFVLSFAVILSVLAQAFIFFRMGGIRGLMRIRYEEVGAFHGMGIPRVFGIALPLLCFIVLTLYILLNRIQVRSVLTVLICLFLFGLFQLVVAGTYGSRGMIVTSIFWMLGIIHYFWRPLSHKFIICLLLPGILFMWMYSFYKALGPLLFSGRGQDASVQEIARETGRTFERMLIGDFSRVDIQAYILFAQNDPGRDYNLRYGRIYYEALTPIIPSWIWPTKPTDAGKVRAGTELIYGKGYYDRFERRRTTRAYGLAGEAMLNFGFWGVPFAFMVWGFLIGRFRRYIYSLQPGDLRFFIVPYLIWFLPGMLVWDMDNYISHTVMRAGVPILIIFLMSEKLHEYNSQDDEELVEPAYGS